jgi:hypothetical protein
LALELGSAEEGRGDKKGNGGNFANADARVVGSSSAGNDFDDGWMDDRNVRVDVDVGVGVDVGAGVGVGVSESLWRRELGLGLGFISARF